MNYECILLFALHEQPYCFALEYTQSNTSRSEICQRLFDGVKVALNKAIKLSIDEFRDILDRI